MQAPTFTVLGLTDEVSTCDCCGKKNLKRTVALEEANSLQVVYYGVDCAAKSLRLKGSRPALEAQLTEKGKQAVNARITSEINALVQSGALRTERGCYVAPGYAAGTIQAAARLAANWPTLFVAPHSAFNPTPTYYAGVQAGHRRSSAPVEAGINWAR